MREINPFGLRMPAVLREKLQRSARHNRRSLNSEIVERLSRSMESSAGPTAALSTGDAEAHALYGAPPLTAIEETALEIFRGLPADKQLALVSLLK